MVFRLGELFCGPGGIALGAHTAGPVYNQFGEEFRIVHGWATDYDRDTCDTYMKNIPDSSADSVFCEDVRKLDLSKLTNIDALAFGFPCNDFSNVGEQKGINGTFGPLYKYGVEVLRKLQPMWFLAENVGGLKNSNEGNAFKNILEELQNVGYTITPHLYKFEDYEVPQARHRIIIIGIRNDLGMKFQVPVLRTHRVISSQEAIEIPPIPLDCPNHEFTNHSNTVIERLKHIKPGENAFNANLPKLLQLNVKGAKISQIYKRLNPNLPAYTLTGSGGGGTHMYHWDENRALTNRERARIQTFPDEFIFKGKLGSVRKQIGMAVPVRGVKHIIKEVLNSFAGLQNTDYDYITPNIRFDDIMAIMNVARELDE